MVPHSGESELITDVGVLVLFPSVKEPKPGVAAGAFTSASVHNNKRGSTIRPVWSQLLPESSGITVSAYLFPAVR